MRFFGVNLESERMPIYFVQLVDGNLRNNIMLSGAIMAANRKEAENLAINKAYEYRAVRETNNVDLYLYTLIEVTPDRPVQFAVHSPHWRRDKVYE